VTISDEEGMLGEGVVTTTNAGRSAAARQRVLGSALKAFGVRGYQGSSLAKIAADAGLTTAGLLHHYPSKEELLTAVLVERDRLDGARFRLGGFTGLDALDRLVQLVSYNAASPGLVQTFTVLMGESVSEGHPARNWFRERYPRRRANLTSALQAGIEAGEIRADLDCQSLAAEIIATIDGLQVQWLLNPEDVDMVAVFTHYIDGVRERVRARGRETS
jgi:AcrR family transcriptional regulator